MKRDLSLILVLLGTLSGCSRSTDWSDLKVDIQSTIDGKITRSVGLWRNRVTSETFLSSEFYHADVEGQAVAIPLGGGRYIYALVRSSRNWTQSGGEEFLWRIDGELLSSHRFPLSDPMSSHKAALDILEQRSIPICQKDEKNLKNVCPIFIYFDNELDSKSGHSINVGQSYKLFGHKVIINKVVLSYSKPASVSDAFSGHIPNFLSQYAKRSNSLRDKVCFFQDHSRYDNYLDNSHPIAPGDLSTRFR